MIRKFISATIVFLYITAATITAQNSEKGTNILEHVQKKIESYNTFSINMEINGEKGEITVSGNCFRMSNSLFTVWYNGTDQWTYIKESDEVNITNPDDSELGSINPYSFLKNWKNTCTAVYTGDKKINGKNCSTVELKAKNHSGFDNITIFVSQSFDIEQMTIKDSNGYEFTVQIKGIKKNINKDKTFFSFSRKDCPDAEIIDLR